MCFREQSLVTSAAELWKWEENCQLEEESPDLCKKSIAVERCVEKKKRHLHTRKIKRPVVFPYEYLSWGKILWSVKHSNCVQRQQQE